MTKSRIKDQFLYALLAVVFGAAAVIFTKVGLGEPSKPPVEVLGAQTADELMMELSKTVDGESETEVGALKQEAMGL